MSLNSNYINSRDTKGINLVELFLKIYRNKIMFLIIFFLFTITCSILYVYQPARASFVRYAQPANFLSSEGEIEFLQDPKLVVEDIRNYHIPILLHEMGYSGAKLESIKKKFSIKISGDQTIILSARDIVKKEDFYNNFFESIMKRVVESQNPRLSIEKELM